MILSYFPRRHPRVDSPKLALLLIVSAMALGLVARADPVTLTIQGSGPYGYNQYNGGVAGLQWVPEAQSYINGINGSTTFNFSIGFDSATTASAGHFTGLTLNSGTVGSTVLTDTSVTANVSGNMLSIFVTKLVFDFPDPFLPGRDQYISANFIFKFNDPTQLHGGTTLPTNFSLSDLNYYTAEFRYSGGDAGGAEYAYFSTGTFSSINAAPQGSGGSSVPDGGSTAFLLSGTAALLAGARRWLAV